MSGFSGSDKYMSFETSGRKETVCGTIKDIKDSPEKGKKRLIVKQKGGAAQTCAVDLDVENLKKVKRKEAYAFQVEEKDDDRYGSQGRKKESNFKTYYCDTVPESYGGAGGRTDFTDFSSSKRW